MTTYRLATEHEINDIARKLNTYTLWYNAKTFIKQFYPDTAFSFKLGVDGEYNDEGGTSYSVDSIDVVDCNNKLLKYDYTKPSWALAFQDDIDVLYSNYEDDEYEITTYLKERYTTPKGANSREWRDWEDISMFVDSYEHSRTTFLMGSFPDVPPLYLAVEE